MQSNYWCIMLAGTHKATIGLADELIVTSDKKVNKSIVVDTTKVININILHDNIDLNFCEPIKVWRQARVFEKKKFGFCRLSKIRINILKKDPNMAWE